VFYADESGFEQSYNRTYGYSFKGKRVYGEVYGKRFARESVVGAIDTNNNFFAGFAFKGYMNSGLFEGWLECVFVPAIKRRKAKNPILIIDNASHHPKERIADIADENGFRVIFLPKYSPDLNPIEAYWANVKNWLRLHLCRFDSFWEAFVMAFRVR
jgi:transposase